MSNIFGNNVKISVFGESHGPYIGITIDGLVSGIELNEDFINECLRLRRPSNQYETKRVEEDEYQIISGVFNNVTTGSPLTIIIPNKNVNSDAYLDIKDKARPGHADYAAHVKYHGYEDYRGGGHFSGRVTAAIVAGGAIVLQALERQGILIGTHILSVGDVKDRKYGGFAEEIRLTNKMSFPVLNEVQEAMEKEIFDASKDGDSIGGVIETMVLGLPAGLGNPMFDSIESMISHAMFSIGAIKGVEFGAGFDLAKMRGSEANDTFAIDNGEVTTKTNNNGGVNGGISNGMPITFNVAVKPTPSISKEQKTISMSKLEDTTINITGRHDPAIIRRVNIVVRCMTAFVIADLLVSRYGEDFFLKGF